MSEFLEGLLESLKSYGQVTYWLIVGAVVVIVVGSFDFLDKWCPACHRFGTKPTGRTKAGRFEETCLKCGETRWRSNPRN